MSQLKVVRDSALDYGSDLVFTLEGEPFTGIAFEESAALGRSEVSYRRGVQDGPARDWYPSGVLKGESHFVDGVLHGASTEFDEVGRLVAEAHHEYGICTVARRFGPNGSLIATEELDPASEAVRLLGRLRSEHGWPT